MGNELLYELLAGSAVMEMHGWRVGLGCENAGINKQPKST